MFETLITKITSLLLAPILFLTGVFAPDQAPLGVALPSGTAVFETSLAAGITADATTMTLTSASIRGGGTLSGYQCFAIDEGSAQAEFVCGTASSTSVSGLERGISPADGITEDTDLQFSHRRGASVKITDFPLIQRIKSQNAGEGTYEAPLTYAGGVGPVNSSDLADKEYVLSVVNGGTVSFDKVVISGTAGETVSTGTVVYLKPSDQRWWKVDTDDYSTYLDRELGLAQGPGTAGASISGGVLMHGFDQTQLGMTPGAFIFASSTAGATSTATSTQILGIAVSATSLFFDQNLIDSSTYIPTAFSASTTFASSSFSGSVLIQGANPVGTDVLFATTAPKTASGGSGSLSYNFTIPGGILDTDGGLEIHGVITNYAADDNAAGTSPPRITVSYGGTGVVLDCAAHSANDLESLIGSFTAYVVASSSASQQFIAGSVNVADGADGEALNCVGTGGASIDSTTSQTLSISGANNSANDAMTIGGIIVRKLKP